MTDFPLTQWNEKRNVVITMQPSPGDIFVFVTIGGKVGFHFGINEYMKAVQIAEDFARHKQLDPPIVIKVLPLSLKEAINLNLVPKDLFQNMTAAEEVEYKKIIRETCTSALLHEPDPNVRADALQLLQSLGGLPCQVSAETSNVEKKHQAQRESRITR